MTVGAYRHSASGTHPVDLPDSYLLTGGTLVDPRTSDAVVADLSITDDRVVAGHGAAHAGVPVPGLFLLPGLVDMHVHLVPSLIGQRAIGDDVIGTCAQTLSRALSSGVTTVRDLGGEMAILLTLRRAQEAGAVHGSRMFIGGPAVCAPHGHGTHSGHGIAVSSPADAACVVDALALAGVDHIKIVTSGARGDVEMQPDVLFALAAAARARRLPVAVHAHFQPRQLAAAVRARVCSIEHGFLLHTEPHLLRTMAADGTFLCPTLRVIESIRAHPQRYGQRIIPDAWPDALHTVDMARVEGVSLLAGTDSGVFGVQPSDVWREVTLIAEACGSRWVGLQAATSNAGRALGRDDIGRLGEGALADVTILRRDPVRTAVDERDVVAVIQAGRLVAGSLPSDPPR